MAGKTAVLKVNIISDGKNAAKGLDEASAATGRFQSGLKKLALPAAAVVAGIAVMAKKTYDLASEAEQNLGAVDTVFGKSASKIKSWSADSANAVGMSTSSYQSLANSIGGSLKSAYSDTDEMAAKTKELIGAGADLSSVFGGDAAEAAAAMGSALRGEFNPLERFGIFLNANAVNAQLAATGQDKLSGAAADAAKKQMIQNLIMEQAAKYSGNFAREADTAAGAQQRATAQWENAQAKLGTALLPIMVKASSIFSEFSGWVSENTGVVTALVGVVGGLAVGILAVNAAFSIYAAGQKVAAAATWLFNSALLANPITWVIIAVVALVAAVVLAYNKIGWFKDAMNAAWAAIKVAVAATVDWFKNTALPFMQAVFTALGTAAIFLYQNFIKPAFERIQSIVRGVISFVTNVVNAGMALLRGDFSGAMGFIKNAVRDGLNIVNDYFGGIPGRILAALGNFGSLLWGAGQGIIDGFFNGLKAGWGKVTDFVGGIAGWIAANKGPLPYDKRLLKPAGAAIMGGLLSSMKAQMPAMKKFLGNVTDTIAGIGTDAGPVQLVGGRVAVGTQVGALAPAGTMAPQIVVNVTAGVGDPVEIGRVLDGVLTKFYRATGKTGGTR